MEYETFLNSAYFQQGRADEFTRQKPDARKRILADILDLSRYDRLEEMARQRRSDCELEIKDLEGEIRHLEARVVEEPAYQEALTQHEGELARWSAERASREERLGKLRAELAALTEKEARLREREERREEAQREVDELTEEIGRLEERLSQEQGLLEDAEQIRADLKRLQEMRALVERLDKDVQEVHTAREALATANGRLQLRRRELEAELAAAESEWKAAQQRAERAAYIDRQIREMEPQLALLQEAEEEISREQTRLAEANQEFANLKAENERVQREIKDIEDVLELLSRPKSQCPVCESDLGAKQPAGVIKQETKKRGLEAKLADVKAAGKARKLERDEIERLVDSLNARIAGAAAIKGRKIEMERQRQELMDQNASSVGVEERAQSLRGKLETEDYGEEERAEIRSLDGRIAELKSAAERHTAARQTVKELTERGTESRFARLEEAERNHVQLERDLASASGKRDRRRTQIAAEEERLNILRAELSGLDSARVSASQAEGECQEATREVESARGMVERTRHALEECAAARKLRDQKAAEREKVLKDRQAYTDLAAAFGKKGVQALIIDNALPEIQDEANRLLARMTDNQMQVGLSTVRQARSGSGQIETLDITITDDAGTRPYEMYSGGESFRVNFAIRIALSRLLARRAGARLQTLIIDEGFGTQDAKGRERLVEAIETIRDEFSLILAITHIEELKDAFPTRIEITKNQSGSQFNFVD
jgi:exonuclease SbcC